MEKLAVFPSSYMAGLGSIVLKYTRLSSPPVLTDCTYIVL